MLPGPGCRRCLKAAGTMDSLRWDKALENCCREDL